MAHKCTDSIKAPLIVQSELGANFYTATTRISMSLNEIRAPPQGRVICWLDGRQRLPLEDTVVSLKLHNLFCIIQWNVAHCCRKTGQQHSDDQTNLGQS